MAFVVQDRYDSLHTDSEIAEKRLVDVNKILEQLMSGIDTLFKKVECDPKPIKEMLGGNSGITPSNVLRYLGMIEQRTTELINVLYYMRVKRGDSTMPKLDTIMPAATPVQKSGSQIIPG